MAQDEVTIVLPSHAVRYLRGMCARERTHLNSQAAWDGYGLGLEAAYDSLNTILDAILEFIPDED